MKPIRTLILIALAGPLCAQDDLKQAPAAIEKPSERGVGKPLPADSPLAPLIADSKLLVVVFTAPDCPVSKLYRPKLDRMDKEYRARGVRFLTASSSDASLTALLDARRSTEVFVIDPKGVLRYRGAVDDQYGIGYSRDAATKNLLVDAIEALLAGKAPAILATEAPGCEIERPSKPGASPLGTGKIGITFHKDVAPIFQRRCVDCHRPGEIGPFSLLSYETAKSKGRTIKEAVTKKRMPPWHADPKHGEWSNDRHLSSQEIETISAWVDAGAPQGSAKDAPAPRRFAEGWLIGTPDAVYKMPRAQKIPAEGTVPYKYFFVRTDLKEDTWVQAIEVRPGARQQVHHILVFLQYPLNRLKEQPPLDGGLFHGYFGIMVPGESPMIFPEGMGKKVPAGATLVFQIHYTTNGEAAEDVTQVGLVFAKKPVTREVVTRGIVNAMIRIPAGAPDHREEASFTFENDSKILSLLPHMHIRGKAFKYTAIHPDGKEEVLLDVPVYDFNWQTCYRLKEPKLVKKGTKIQAVAHFDNSKGNPGNPDPTKEVRFGQQSWEEMLIGYMDFVKVD